MMIRDKYLLVINLIKAFLTGRKCEIPADVDFAFALKTAKKHQLSAIMLEGAKICGMEEDSLFVKELFNNVCFFVAEDTKQSLEIAKIFKLFSQNDIDYMPLKGTVLKQIYPKSVERQMNDIDILIREEDLIRIIPILTSNLGFIRRTESDHEYIFEKKGILLELHKKLIPSYHEDLYSYVKDGFSKAVVSEKNKNEYVLSNEDLFIYLFLHFSKHYRAGGIGLKYLIDFCILILKFNLDYSYIETELEKVKLKEFYFNVRKTADAFLGRGDFDDISETITLFLFKSGLYGKQDLQSTASVMLNKKGEDNVKKVKARNIFYAVFPKFCDMKIKYPVLCKAPVLLPLMWLIRLFEAIITPQKIKAKRDRILGPDENKVKEFENELKIVGLL